MILTLKALSKCVVDDIILSFFRENKVAFHKNHLQGLFSLKKKKKKNVVYYCCEMLLTLKALLLL